MSQGMLKGIVILRCSGDGYVWGRGLYWLDLRTSERVDEFKNVEDIEKIASRATLKDVECDDLFSG